MEENEISFLYKMVVLFQCPARLIIMRDVDINDNLENFTVFKNSIYESSFDAMYRLLLKGYTNKQIIEYFKFHLSDYTDTDINMIYFDKIREIIEQTNELVEIIKEKKLTDQADILKAAKKIIGTGSHISNSYYKSLYDRAKKVKDVMKNDSLQLQIKNSVNVFTREIQQLQSVESATFNNYSQILRDFNTWYFFPTPEDDENSAHMRECIQDEIYKDLIKRNEVRNRNEYISEIKQGEIDIYITETEIKSATFLYKPKTRDLEDVTEEDGYDIFDFSEVSQYVPYIKYVNSYGKPFYKLFKGESTTEIPDFKTMMIEMTGENKPNTIVASLWLGDLKDKTLKMHEAPKDTFFRIIYRIGPNKKSENIMEVETILAGGSSNNVNYALERVRAAFPSLHIPDENIEDKVKCEFSIYNLFFDEKGLYHLMQNKKPYSYFFTTIENTKQYAYRKNIQIGYFQEKILEENGKPNVVFNLNQKSANSEEVKKVYTKNSNTLKSKKFEAGTDYVRVSVIKSRSRDILKPFIETLKLIFLQYKNHDKQKIDEFYLQSLPNLYKIGGNKSIKEKPIIEKLKEAAPEMFVGGYARICPPNRQPIIINAKEKIKWEKKGLKPRIFPKENPYLFVCPRDPLPKLATHIGVQRNRNAKNKNEFPFVPCCFKKPTDTKTGSYTRYMEGKFSVSPASKGSMLISNPSILLPTVPSYVPSVKVFELLSSSGTKEIYRRGVIFSNNSFLHCVCDALIPEYENLANEKEKEDYVVAIRKDMAKNLEPSLLKQELYEYDEEEISNLMYRGDTFFDPIYYYRAVEETFNVNIFMFGIEYPDPKTKNKDKGFIQMPNFKLMYCRNFKEERTNILVLRNWGTAANDLETPQCELLVHYDFSNKIIYKTFDESIGNLCNNSINHSLQTYTCVFNREDYSSENPRADMPISVYKNIFYSLDHLKMYSGIPISQYIDPCGKVRAINFKTKNGHITVCTLPAQPENLPTETKIYRTDYKFALKYFGIQPSYVSTDFGGNIDGLWFSLLGVEQAEYVPINPINRSILAHVPEGEKCYIVSENTEVTTRLKKLRKTLNIIVQLVRWVFEIFSDAWDKKYYKNRVAEELRILAEEGDEEAVELFRDSNVVDMFMQWYTGSIVGNEIEDSAQFYDISFVKQSLPTVKTVEEALEYIHSVTTNLIRRSGNGELSFQFYNEIFSEKIKNNIWYRNSRGIPKVIPDFYKDETDFRYQTGSIVFTSEEDLNYWLESLQSGSKHLDKIYKINNQIEKMDWERKEPFLIKDEIGKIYIVQNTEDGSKYSAMQICEEWIKNTINIGRIIPEYLRIEKVIDHVLYSVDQLGKLYPVEIVTGEDNPNDEIDFEDPNIKISQIFYYNEKKSKTGSRKYAALLPLL